MSLEMAKSLINVVSLLALGYAGILLLVFVFQRSLLYFPDQSFPSQRYLSNQGLALWPSERQYLAISSSELPEEAQGTVIVFHGNAGAAHHRGYYIEALEKRGLRVILAEYPGYGGRPGNLSADSLIDDGIETVKTAYLRYGEPVFLWGESLGTGVVSGILKAAPVPVKGAVLLTPFDTLGGVAQTHYPFLPARWLVKDRFNNIDALQGFSGNVAVILAGRDEVIPVKHGERLFESIDSNKKHWRFEQAGHNSIPLSPDLNWWDEVISFISQ